MRKTLNKLGVEKIYLNVIKTIYDVPRVDIVLYEDESFSSKIGNLEQGAHVGFF